MTAYLLRRVLATLPVIFVVALIVFSLLYLSPGDPAMLIAGDQASAEELEHIRVSLGLDEPFLVRFGSWLWQILGGSLGVSIFTNMPVGSLIAARVEPTISIMVLTLLFALAVGVPLGIAAAAKPGGWVDRISMSSAVLGFSVPGFVLGYLLAYVFGLKLGWFPVQGYSPLGDGVVHWLRSLALPALSLSSIYIAVIARTTRAAMLDVLQHGYIRTARAKGAGRASLLYVHALRNAALPVVTVVGIGVALLIGGAVVAESVFAIPGVGRLTVDAILRRDYPVIQGVVLLSSLMYVVVNLLIDLLYVVIDPRVRL
ncbi:MAG TPA: ABC transporter permease [Ramlibacter sp.]|uniref:ABC transporter permease n=1 Tax=Ramlibacter sp. TaxID=1917967 RepID=UPI002C411C4F|nr:ABC transporter permease [Ramlibacter sp.]HVZ46605.1 ABC transporter permease [Ramlibacter sp.]